MRKYYPSNRKGINLLMAAILVAKCRQNFFSPNFKNFAFLLSIYHKKSSDYATMYSSKYHTHLKNLVYLGCFPL